MSGWWIRAVGLAIGPTLVFVFGISWRLWFRRRARRVAAAHRRAHPEYFPPED